MTSGSALSRPAPPGVPGVPRRADRGGRGRRLAVTVLVAAVTIAVVRAFLFQSFVVPTGSMEPTVRIGDRVLVSRIAYRFGEVRRGDVVVFDGGGVFEPATAPAASPLGQLGRGIARAFSLPVGSRDYVKRVVGLPGERVVCCDAAGRITVDGTPLVEDYIDPLGPPSRERFDVVVQAGRLWVMGDHRSASADSRAHRDAPGGGTVPVDHVVGRVVGIYWPMSHVRQVNEDPVPAGTAAGQAEGRR